jgi:hypothetical protein
MRYAGFLIRPRVGARDGSDQAAADIGKFPTFTMSIGETFSGTDVSDRDRTYLRHDGNGAVGRSVKIP